MPDSPVIIKTWADLTADDVYDFTKLRTDIYFLEQKIDEEELDNRDKEPATTHFWIADEVGTAAYLRTIIEPEPQFRDALHSFGRVVVRADRRGEGLAQLLIDEVMTRYGTEPMFLHAQSYIVPLYEKYGFATEGDEYIEAGLPHILMYRPAE